jgi:hypothetical protein
MLRMQWFWGHALSDDDRESLRMTPLILHRSAPLRSPSAGTRQLRLWHKALLILGALWAALVIAPDFYRLVVPLGSFGFSTNNDGVIYEVSDKPATVVTIPGETEPGLKKNDRVELSAAPCWHPENAAIPTCRDFLAVFGGMGGLSYVLDGTKITLPIVRNDKTKILTLTAVHPDRDWWTLSILMLDEIAGLGVLAMALYLVWVRPGRMTLGFFLYAMWFNPGQYFMFYAWLQSYPVWVLLTQEVLQALAQGAGYAGFLIFALQFPHDRTEPNLRGVERWAIPIGATLAILQLASFANVFGYHTELVTRVAIGGGVVVAVAAMLIVGWRLKRQPPLDRQRMIWVLSGCLIGLPAFIFADLTEATSWWANAWPQNWDTEAIVEVGYLVSGVMAIFISLAVLHRRIVNVTPTLLTLLSLVITLIGIGWIEYLADEWTATKVGPAAKVVVAIGIAVVFGIVVYPVVERLTDKYLNRSFHHASTQLAKLGREVMRPTSIEEIDAILVNGPHEAFHLASAALFREERGVLRRVPPTQGWGNESPIEIDSPAGKRLLEKLMRGDAVPIPLPPHGGDDAPVGITAPALAVPVMIADKLYAVALFGPHETGADFDRMERKSLENFAQNVAVGYETIRMDMAEREIQVLRRQIANASGAPA